MSLLLCTTRRRRRLRDCCQASGRRLAASAEGLCRSGESQQCHDALGLMNNMARWSIRASPNVFSVQTGDYLTLDKGQIN